MSCLCGITEKHLQILALYTNGYDRDYYPREIPGVISVSHGTAHKILISLEEKGVLESVTRGRTRIFRLKKTNAAVNHLLLAESYKRLKFFESEVLAGEIIYKVMPFFKGPLALFGSYSSGTTTPDSDIDLLSAGDFDKTQVDKISKTFGIEINVKKYPGEVFTRAAKEDTLIKEMYKNHIFLKCPEFFLEAVIV
ncbi:hypothetical protein F1737_00570 [Methanoplanus sp. FWC-SCC4]|uniref:Polymerase nucleotidyl transferase domain-containing protein n=1 Tax=Methanochimaera problematica TaxID=2609417 RepID=A0AA97FD53_9EURY|nr:nucleotidyltransferase domain-containing protein [Methanoplanus sp. FWC-SCC4]WOF15276.1 hypothetical protein F1737_00570 [Methanoplanus sp. FWC-SCC4]